MGNVFKKIRDGRGRTYFVGLQATFTYHKRTKRGQHVEHDGWTWRVKASRFPLVTAVIVSE